MNPVFLKDMVGLLRLRRVVALQVVYVALLAMAVLGTWPQQQFVPLASRNQDPLLLSLILGQLALLMLFIPGIAGVAICGEREANTLEMLYCSRLSPAQLVIGKVLSAIGLPMMLLLQGLPFAAMLQWRGEADVATLGRAYFVLTLSAVMLAMVSLAVSAWCRRNATALVVSYLILLMIGVGVLVPAAMMLRSQGGIVAEGLHGIRGASPVGALLSLLRPGLAELGGRRSQVDLPSSLLPASMPPAWQIFVPFAIAVTVTCFVLVVLTLRRAPLDVQRPPRAAAHGKPRNLWRRLMFLVDPHAPRRPIGWIDPIIVNELRTNQVRSGRWMIRLFYASLLFSLALALMALYGGSEHQDLLAHVAATLVAFQIGMVALVGPSLTSPAISSEIEGGTIELLRLAPVSAGRIFWGKFLPALAPALLPVVALVPAYATLALVNAAYIRPVSMLIPVLALAVVFCCAAGLACSTFVAATTRSTVASYLIVAAVIVVPLLAWWSRGLVLDTALARWLAIPSPLVAALDLLPKDASDHAGTWPGHLWTMGGICVALIAAARWRLARLLARG